MSLTRPPRRRARPKTLGSVVVTLLLGVLAAWLNPRAPSPAERPRPPPPEIARPAPPASHTAEAGDFDLEREESRGGHTLARHVGKTDAELRARLSREPGISAASTFTDRSTAGRCVADALAANRDRVRAWSAGGPDRPTLALDFRGDQPLGRSLRRGEASPVTCTDANIVLRPDRRYPFVVLTAYPEPRRGR